jgi:hypothetical protein
MYDADLVWLPVPTGAPVSASAAETERNPVSDACALKHVRPLLNVAQLRVLLERVERNGGGDWEIDVFPDSLVARNAEHDNLDFSLLRYGIAGVDTLVGDEGQAFVLLRFAPAPLDTR